MLKKVTYLRKTRGLEVAQQEHKKAASAKNTCGLNGYGAYRIRTDDLLHAMQAL